MLKQNQRTLALSLAIIILLACAPLATPIIATPPPTFDLLSVNTSIAQTAGAAATQTFVLLPTLTSTPTLTVAPTETPSSTPTFIFILPTWTVPPPTSTLDVSSERYACQVMSQTPANESGFIAGVVFQTRWEVGNIGKEIWDANSSDIRYSSGAKLHRTAVFDLETSIPPGGRLEILVDMRAPMETGAYTTTWRIKVGKTEFCPMKLKIVVQ